MSHCSATQGVRKLCIDSMGIGHYGMIIKQVQHERRVAGRQSNPCVLAGNTTPPSMKEVIYRPEEQTTVVKVVMNGNF